MRPRPLVYVAEVCSIACNFCQSCVTLFVIFVILFDFWVVLCYVLCFVWWGGLRLVCNRGAAVARALGG